jgi:hypothetical protein
MLFLSILPQELPGVYPREIAGANIEPLRRIAPTGRRVDTALPFLNGQGRAKSWDEQVFTAAAVMKLVDRGQLSLDEPVTNKLVNLPPAWNPVTVRHCLDHMSGLPDALDEREQLRSTNGLVVKKQFRVFPQSRCACG